MDNRFTLTPFTFPSFTYIQPGVGRVTKPSYTTYKSNAVSEFYNGLYIEVYYKGSNKSNMSKYVSNFAGHSCDFLFSEIDQNIKDMESKIQSLLNECIEPSEDNKKLLRKIFNRDLAEGIYMAVFSVLSNARVNRLERRWIAKTMLSKKTCSIIDIINNYNYL